MTDVTADPRAPLGAGSVAIIGCGGLGSNVAVMLVRAGVRTLTLVDFDCVEEDNLNRQFFFREDIGLPKAEALAASLGRIMPGLRLRVIVGCATSENLLEMVAGADVIVEAVDTPEGKTMIIDVCASALPDVPLVTASGLAGDGSANEIVTERLADNVYLIGDLVSDVRAGLPLYASRVMVAAAHEAHMVVRILLGLPNP